MPLGYWQVRDAVMGLNHYHLFRDRNAQQANCAPSAERSASWSLCSCLENFEAYVTCSELAITQGCERPRCTLVLRIAACHSYIVLGLEMCYESGNKTAR